MVTRNVLPAKFYDRDTLDVARGLLGKILRVKHNGAWRAGYIVEDEAYLRDDPACHSYRGETARNRSMFQDPGTAYVYRIHQVYCVNAVTRKGEAVLIRALQSISPDSMATSGPGRLCRALGITCQEYDGKNFTSSRSLQIVGDGLFGDFETATSTRIGLSKAVDKPYRFYVKDNDWVSR